MAASDGSDAVDPAAAGEEAPEPRGRPGLVVGVALVVVVLDQLTKTWAVRELQDQTIDVVGSLRFNLVFNSGASFSFGEGLGPVIALIVVGVSVAIFVMGRKTSSVLGALALGLLLGGAVGNLVDRALRSGDGFLGGHVVDFVDLQWWPVFNVADAAVSVGGVLLVLYLVIGDRGAASGPPGIDPG